MGIFGFGKRAKPAPKLVPAGTPLQVQTAPVETETYLPEVTVSHSPDGKLTTIDGSDFLLQIPFRWERVSNEQSLEFRNQMFPEQLIITARLTREPLTIDQRRLLIEKLVECHRNAMKEISASELQMTSVDQVHNEDGSEGRFYAKAPGMGMAHASRYICGRVLTFSLYRYTDQDFGMKFGVYAGAMLDLLKVRRRHTAM